MLDSLYGRILLNSEDHITDSRLCNLCTMIIITESVLRLTSVPALLSSHLFSFVWLKKSIKVYLCYLGQWDSWIEIIKKYIMKFFIYIFICFSLNNFSMEHKFWWKKIHLLWTTEKFRSLANENWFNSLQKFVCKMKQKLHFHVSIYTKHHLSKIKHQ